jgi:TPR repeat protein
MELAVTGVRMAIMSALLGLGMSSAFAQADEGAAKAAPKVTTGPIIELLQDKRSPQRDRRLYELAVTLFNAIETGAERNVDDARHLMARALHEAAQGNIPEAWVDYGRCLWNGWGVKEDGEAALSAYKKAAALGSDYGAYLAAYNLYWTFKRYDEAYAIARKALRGDPSGEAHYLVGLMTYTGRGHPNDIKEGLRMHQPAARLGNADAMFELYVASMNGIGDRETAAFFLKEAERHRAAVTRALAGSRRLQHVDHASRHQVLVLRAVFLHVRRDRMRLEVIRTFPLLDHHERVRAVGRGSHILDIDRRAIFDAAGLGEHGRPVRGEILQDGGALAGLGGDDGDDMDHEVPPRFLN